VIVELIEKRQIFGMVIWPSWWIVVSNIGTYCWKKIS